MNNLGHKLFKGFQDVVSSVKPTLKESKFYTDGILTPEEFIEAGDFLTSKCPTWKWCAAKKESLYNKALPKDKQYLKTTVPSYRRAEDYLKSNSTKETIIEGDWVDADLENKPKDSKKEGAPVTLDMDEMEEKEREFHEFARWDGNYPPSAAVALSALFGDMGDEMGYLSKLSSETELLDSDGQLSDEIHTNLTRKEIGRLIELRDKVRVEDTEIIGGTD